MTHVSETKNRKQYFASTLERSAHVLYGCLFVQCAAPSCCSNKDIHRPQLLYVKTSVAAFDFFSIDQCSIELAKLKHVSTAHVVWGVPSGATYYDCVGFWDTEGTSRPLFGPKPRRRSNTQSSVLTHRGGP